MQPRLAERLLSFARRLPDELDHLVGMAVQITAASRLRLVEQRARVEWQRHPDQMLRAVRTVLDGPEAHLPLLPIGHRDTPLLGADPKTDPETPCA